MASETILKDGDQATADLGWVELRDAPGEKLAEAELQKRPERTCSFCGERESATLVFFAQAAACICGDCVTGFVGVMLESRNVMRQMLQSQSQGPRLVFDEKKP